MRVSTVHSSLNRTKSMMGVDHLVFKGLALLGSIFVMLSMWGFLLFLPVGYWIARWMFARDPLLLQANIRYSREKDQWDAWHHPKTVNKRPRGYGKGLPC